VLQEPSLRATSAAPAAAQNLSFGPLVEREFTNGFMLDFDSGRIATNWPEAVTKPDSIVEEVLLGFDWMRREGMDFAWLENDGTYSVGMKLKELAPADFADLTATQLAAMLAVAGTNPTQTKLALNSNEPSIYGFQTREGGLGILQINGFTENPRGVKIRYKLAQHSEAQTPKPAAITGQVTDQNGKPLANVRWRISAIEAWRDGQWELTHNLGEPNGGDRTGRFGM
jgi:hypothetical protein